MYSLKHHITTVFLSGLLLACNDKQPEEASPEMAKKEAGAEVEEAMLTAQQYAALDMEIDTLARRLMTGFIQADGHLEVPPQGEAAVSAVIGANIAEILVIEGDEVRRGEVLGYLSHPDIVELQTELLHAANRLDLLEKEFARQEKLYNAGVGSGENFQRAEAELKNAEASLKGLKAQLKLLHLDPTKIINGRIYGRIPVVSPIEGAVQAVHVRTGEYVQAQSSILEIMNTEHIHVDLMVFEKDIAKVEVGQKVFFTVATLPGQEVEAEIISISKGFEETPKALHVHAELLERPKGLVPGMYVSGKIAVESQKALALPEAAVARNGESFYIFRAEEEGDAWSFKPVEVVPGPVEGEWMAVEVMQEVPRGQRFAYNNAYYLMAEMKKGEGGGHHH